MKVKIRILKKFDVGDKIATQSAQKGTNSHSMKYEDINLPLQKNYRIIYDSGKSPPRLKKLHGEIRIKTTQKGRMKITALMANGNKQRVKVSCVDNDDRYTVWKFLLDGTNTPWFFLDFDEIGFDCNQKADS